MYGYNESCLFKLFKSVLFPNVYWFDKAKEMSFFYQRIKTMSQIQEGNFTYNNNVPNEISLKKVKWMINDYSTYKTDNFQLATVALLQGA